jgi:hypothetical protein
MRGKMKSTATSTHEQNKAEPARSHAGNPLRSNFSTGYLGQLSAMINSSPSVLAQRELSQEIQSSPRVQGQQQLASEINQGPATTAPSPIAQPSTAPAQRWKDEFPTQGETNENRNISQTEAESHDAPAQLAAAAHSPLSNAGSIAPVQRKIELHDRDEGTYRETEKEKVASDAGDLLFTGGYYKTLPVFLNAKVVNFVIKFVEEAMGIDEKTEDETYYKELDKGIKTLSGGVAEALGEAVFYTDDAVVTKEISFPGHWLAQALKKPLLRDPLAKRGGFMNRFQSAFGTLFTPRSKEETEEDLGELPEKVQYQKVANATTAFALFGQGNKPLISGPYMYVRNALAAAPSRDEGSVFTAKNAASIQDPEDERLTGDALTASLPPAAADSNELVTHKAYARKKSRGLGQIAAMNGWNALGYAGYFTHHGKGPLNVGVDWEWLHIRGAQNGGDTAPENLVAGTSTANSAMIPIEDKINEWTSKATGDRPLMIRYIGKRVSGTNLGNAITLKIWAPEGLPDTLDKTDESKSLEATFNPLKETSFDKMHRQMVAAQQEHAGHGSAVKKNT